MGDIRLSVIIPGFNNPTVWWYRCIDSVLAQIGPNDEIICVDDGSRVAPVSVQKCYSRDHRLKFHFCMVNQGLSSARNVGLDLARGKYVTFVDSDDELCGSAYEASISKLEERGADICVFGVRSLWPAERLCRDNEAPAMLCGVMTPGMLKILYANHIFNYAWNKVFRRQFLDNGGIRFDPKGVPCEDVIFILACIEKGAIWASIQGVGIVYYRTHDTLLSRYKKTYVEGIRNCNRAWQACAKAMHSEIPLQLDYIDEETLMKGEWDNIWKIGSPYSLSARYRFLKDYPAVCNGHPMWCFMRMFVFKSMRKLFYTASVRRWHIRRLYPETKSL